MWETSGDIIQIDKDYYMVNSIGTRNVRLVDQLSLNLRPITKSINIGIKKELET